MTTAELELRKPSDSPTRSVGKVAIEVFEQFDKPRPARQVDVPRGRSVLVTDETLDRLAKCPQPPADTYED